MAAAKEISESDCDQLQELILSICGQQRGLKNWYLSKNVNGMEVAATILTTAWS